MITVGDLLIKIEANGTTSLTMAERTFVVEVFRAAALTNRKEIMMVKEDIQRAHLEHCLNLTSTEEDQ